MSLSPEMITYIKTGLCPYCKVRMIPLAVVIQQAKELKRAAESVATVPMDWRENAIEQLWFRLARKLNGPISAAYSASHV